MKKCSRRLIRKGKARKLKKAIDPIKPRTQIHESKAGKSEVGKNYYKMLKVWEIKFKHSGAQKYLRKYFLEKALKLERKS